jgi:hypothetical protein
MLVDVDKLIADLIETYCLNRGIDRRFVETILDDCLRKQGLKVEDGKIVKM